jgi:hypothetical protein
MQGGMQCTCKVAVPEVSLARACHLSRDELQKGIMALYLAASSRVRFLGHGAGPEKCAALTWRTVAPTGLHLWLPPAAVAVQRRAPHHGHTPAECKMERMVAKWGHAFEIWAADSLAHTCCDLTTASCTSRNCLRLAAADSRSSAMRWASCCCWVPCVVQAGRVSL